jgi:synaptojanin
MNIAIFVHFSIEKFIRDVNSNYIKTGMGNLVGNKGAVAVSYKYKEKSFLFIGCHLAAGHSATENRNRDFYRINTSLSISNKSASEEKTISDQFDVCVLFGDLNYRVNINAEVATKLIQNDALDTLLEYDQLYDEAQLNNLQINNFDEGLILFNPTYKYYPALKEDENKCNYDLSERTPSWTDRILFKSDEDCLTQIKYNSIQETYTSDHKPVYAVFRCDFKDLDKVLKKRGMKEENKSIENVSKSQVCQIF